MATIDDEQAFLAVWRHLALTPGRTLGALQQGRKDEYVVVTAGAALAFDARRDYAESEVNVVLERWLAVTATMLETDHVQLRRALVDCGLLERDPYGKSYRRARMTPAAWRTALATLEGVDLAAERQNACAADARTRAVLGIRERRAQRGRRDVSGSARGRAHRDACPAEGCSTDPAGSTRRAAPSPRQGAFAHEAPARRSSSPARARGRGQRGRARCPP